VLSEYGISWIFDLKNNTAAWSASDRIFGLMEHNQIGSLALAATV
jgi:hypothetical protein